MKDLDHVTSHFLREVEHFFRIYKDPDGKTVHPLGWRWSRRLFFWSRRRRYPYTIILARQLLPEVMVVAPSAGGRTLMTMPPVM